MVLPFQLMVDVWLKPEPVTVRTKPALPAVALPGLSEEMVGAADETVKLTELEVPPVSVTVTPNVPAVASEVAGMVALICVGLV